MEFEKEYNQFLQDLQQYPNYFQMGTQDCSSNFWRNIAKKIEDEKVELLESSDLDRIQNQNLEACATYYLGDVDKAEQIISKVLEDTNSTSINACAMMAILRYRKGEFAKAKRHLSCIKELAANPYNIDIAKSELAYAYTRLGATFYKKAIEAYTEAVERNPNNMPWKFGLALIYRRCMSTSIQAMFPDLRLETCFNEARKHLTYVLENCTDEKDHFFKAKSYIELADLYSTANITDKLIKTDNRKIIDLINQGVQYLPKNTTILMNAGRLLRHCYKFDKAEELLQKAYNICPNSYICHQLGLIQKTNIIHQHKQLQGHPKTNQRHGPNKKNRASGSWRDHSNPPTSSSQPKVNNPTAIDVHHHPFPHFSPFPHVSPYQATVKQLDPVQRGTFLLDNPPCPIRYPFDPKSLKKLENVQDDDLDPAGNPTIDHQQLAVKYALDDPNKTNKTMATGGPTILPNESKTQKERSETLSKVSLTNTAEAGRVHLVKMTRLINSPGNETYDYELSRKLEPCLVLFKQSAQLGQERNMAVYYDWGIILLQMIPTKFHEVMEKFDHILTNEHSQFYRYRCYEQYGICLNRMSESPDFDEISREDYREDAKGMFRSAIQCWAYCQKLNLSKHFDNPEGNCKSFKSIREILLGEDSGHGTKPKRDMASLYYLVKEYGSSLSLYQEVYDKLQRTSDTAMDSDIIKGIINNHLQLEQYTGVLELLALLLCSKEGLQCLEFKTDVLKQIMHYSIDKHDYQLSESVFNFQKDPNEEVDNDVVIIFNEEDRLIKKKGSTLQNWLSTFSKSGLKVIKITETAANRPRPQEQIKLICNSKMAIFILTNETPSEKLNFLMNTAIKARLDNNYFLKKIFPIVINDGMVPDIFKTLRSMKITHQPNTAEEQDKSEFLKTFSVVFLD